MWKNKVIWPEDIFLQTPHFEQQERDLDGLPDRKTRHPATRGRNISALMPTGRIDTPAAPRADSF
ncbi:hypothetical protein [Noviherbaspirillum aerium]|uniref:hypothetical protein n=1 Tax=Noviherbaspirillum aerium TaxID=2588497 RepID=UPI00124EDEDB|nr:hypothetical protein [Noviherbaspirillum aerium]